MNYPELFITVMTLLFLPNLVYTTENNQDTIYLKDNIKICGKIVDFTEGKEYEIHLEDGSRYIFDMNQIDSVNIFKFREITTKPTQFHEVPTKPIQYELGFTFGTPALANIVLAKHYGVHGIRASGNFLTRTPGLQLEYIYKFAVLTNTYHAINAGFGTYNWKSECKYPDGSFYTSNEYRTYLGIAYNFNYYGFYVQIGLNYNFDNIQPMAQIGYVYQFRD